MRRAIPGRKQRQPRDDTERREKEGEREGKKERERERKRKSARIERRDTRRSRGKGACNWTEKGTSPSLAARPAPCGMVGRGAAAALRAALHGTMRGRRTKCAVRLGVYLSNGGSLARSRNRAHGAKEHGVRVEPRHDTEDLRSAQQSAAARRFPQEGGEAREKARATEERGPWEAAGESRREGGRVRGQRRRARGRGRILSVID